MKICIKKSVLPYAALIAIPILVGTLAAYLTRENMDVYEVIVRPPLSPPALLFPIVWTVLYVLMGVSSARVFLKKDIDKNAASSGLRAYFSSLVLNFGWSIIFFNIGAFFIAFLWLISMLYFIIKTVFCYGKIDKISAYLQVPYILWVTFAGYLNFAIFLLN